MESFIQPICLKTLISSQTKQMTVHGITHSTKFMIGCIRKLKKMQHNSILITLKIEVMAEDITKSTT